MRSVVSVNWCQATTRYRVPRHTQHSPGLIALLKIALNSYLDHHNWLLDGSLVVTVFLSSLKDCYKGRAVLPVELPHF